MIDPLGRDVNNWADAVSPYIDRTPPSYDVNMSEILKKMRLIREVIQEYQHQGACDKMLANNCGCACWTVSQI